MKAKYVRVSGTLIKATANAILLENEEKTASHWIPLSLVHALDERWILDTDEDQPITIRLMEWKAEELNL